MSSRAAKRDLLTVPIDCVQVKPDEYLSDLSQRHKPWDVHRGEADDVTEVFGGSVSPRHRRYAERVENCSQVLGFAHDPLAIPKNKLKLTNVLFCRVRFLSGLPVEKKPHVAGEGIPRSSSPLA